MNTLGGKLLSFDFDGTLYGSFQKPYVSQECLELIEQFSRNGALWGINTGRAYDLLQEGLAEASFLSLPDFFVVKEREVFFKKEDGYEADLSWNGKCEKLHREMYDREISLMQRLKEFVQTQTLAEWISEEGDEAGVVATSVEEMDRIVQHIEMELKSVSGVDYLRSTIYLRFTHADFHKGTALKYVAERFEVAVEDTFAMGDGENDLGMLNPRYAGRLACPSNAVELVKNRMREEGGYVADAEVSEGVVEALKHHFLTD